MATNAKLAASAAAKSVADSTSSSGKPTSSSGSKSTSSGGSGGAKKVSLKPGDVVAVLLGPGGKPIFGPDGKPIDPSLVLPEEPPPPPPPPKPYLGVPPPRWMSPPWEKAPRPRPRAPPFRAYNPKLQQQRMIKLPSQVEFQDAQWGRVMIDLKDRYPKVVKVHLGPVEVTWEKHPGPVQAFLEILDRNMPSYPELLKKPQFSPCNFYAMR